MQISIKENKPIGNAILTCFNKKQAKERFNKLLDWRLYKLPLQLLSQRTQTIIPTTNKLLKILLG